jgi:hypothetical protein
MDSTTKAVQLYWDTSKLFEMGLDEKFISQLSADEIRDFLKGILYLKERYSGFTSE